SLVLYSGLSLGIKSTAVGEKRAQELTHVQAIQQFLRSRISAIKPVKNSKGSAKLLFQGRHHQLKFVSGLPDSIMRGGDAVYSIGYVSDQTSPAIEVVLSAFPQRNNTVGSLHNQVRLEGIKNFSLGYFGAKSGEQKKTWHQQWMNQSQLPILVRVEIVPLSGRAWPPLIIAPLAASVPRRL
ncbi:MAG: hypothetical protein DRQ62_11925, partial [Gammaproteobacteria bacterium]